MKKKMKSFKIKVNSRNCIVFANKFMHFHYLWVSFCLFYFLDFLAVFSRRFVLCFGPIGTNMGLFFFFGTKESFWFWQILLCFIYWIIELLLCSIELVGFVWLLKSFFFLGFWWRIILFYCELWFDLRIIHFISSIFKFLALLE